jgi:phosphoglycerate dehydrogenase-like enzyme
MSALQGPEAGSRKANKLKVLSQLSEPFTLELPPDLKERVEVVPVPKGSEVGPDLRGDVLFGTFGNPQIYDLAERVPWVHYAGTGIDGLDVHRLARGRVLTNSRGVAAIPIAEWVLTVLLFHEKRPTEVFLRQPPERWPVRTPLGTLCGRSIALLGLGAIGSAVAERAFPSGRRSARSGDRQEAARSPGSSSWRASPSYCATPTTS